MEGQNPPEICKRKMLRNAQQPTSVLFPYDITD